MPKFSIFTPFGALAYSSKPSKIQLIYEAIRANVGGDQGLNYSFTPGTYTEASAYARARELARIDYNLQRAQNNAIPHKASEAIPVWEQIYELAPGSGDDIPTRRAALAARERLPGGANYANMVAALTDLLGSDFVNLRVTRSSEVVNTPTNPGDSPANFAPARTTIKQVRIWGGINAGIGTALTGISADLGSPQTVNYVPFVNGASVQLFDGDVIVVDPGLKGITERVTVSSPTATTFVATFNLPHDAGAFATTQPFPYWTSNQRRLTIIVTQTAALDPEKRRKIDELMRRIARGVTTWQIAPKASSSLTGAFTIDDPTLGLTDNAPIEAIPYP